MRSIEQIACAAYEAYCLSLGVIPQRWADLPERNRHAWLKATKAVREEIEAVH